MNALVCFTVVTFNNSFVRNNIIIKRPAGFSARKRSAIMVILEEHVFHIKAWQVPLFFLQMISFQNVHAHLLNVPLWIFMTNNNLWFKKAWWCDDDDEYENFWLNHFILINVGTFTNTNCLIQYILNKQKHDNICAYIYAACMDFNILRGHSQKM